MNNQWLRLWGLTAFIHYLVSVPLHHFVRAKYHNPYVEYWGEGLVKLFDRVLMFPVSLVPESFLKLVPMFRWLLNSAFWGIVGMLVIMYLIRRRESSASHSAMCNLRFTPKAHWPLIIFGVTVIAFGFSRGVPPQYSYWRERVWGYGCLASVLAGLIGFRRSWMVGTVCVIGGLLLLSFQPIFVLEENYCFYCGQACNKYKVQLWWDIPIRSSYQPASIHEGEIAFPQHTHKLMLAARGWYSIAGGCGAADWCPTQEQSKSREILQTMIGRMPERKTEVMEDYLCIDPENTASVNRFISKYSTSLTGNSTNSSASTRLEPTP